ncbi:hypothetical protein ACJX0J_010497, partial [Zea mays]
LSPNFLVMHEQYSGHGAVRVCDILMEKRVIARYQDEVRQTGYMFVGIELNLITWAGLIASEPYFSVERIQWA